MLLDLGSGDKVLPLAARRGIRKDLQAEFYSVASMVTPAGIEPATSGSANQRSIQLSYEVIFAGAS
jgi:hypothetical protein